MIECPFCGLEGCGVIYAPCTEEEQEVEE